MTAALVEEEARHFVELFPKLGEAVHELCDRQHPAYGSLDGLLNAFGHGYLEYLRTSATSEQAYLSMRWLFCATNGRFNDLMERFVGAFHGPYTLGSPAGVLGSLGADSMSEILGRLHQDGFWVFRERLPRELCERLKAFASDTDCLVQPDSTRLCYDPEHPQSVTYRIPDAGLLENRDVQNLLADPSPLAVAQEYLGCQPVISHVGMWWSTALLSEPDSAAAQLYHFDMDRLSFLQFFVYLTDVTSATGPHCFVKGSHKNKPLPLLRDGRFSDEEVEYHYGKENIVEITGPQGTMFAVDTRAFHKGKHLQFGDRLVFQTVYAVNLFGAPHDIIPVRRNPESRLFEAIGEHPRTYARFALDDQ